LRLKWIKYLNCLILCKILVYFNVKQVNFIIKRMKMNLNLIVPIVVTLINRVSDLKRLIFWEFKNLSKFFEF
jgi:hypothetical protein